MNGPPRPVTVLFVVEDDRPVGALHLHDCLQGGHRMSATRMARSRRRRGRGSLACCWRRVGRRPRPQPSRRPRRPAAATSRSRSSSDRLVLEQDQQLATFTGNVDAVQGDTTLRTDLLRVFYTSDEERQASGEPADA